MTTIAPIIMNRSAVLAFDDTCRLEITRVWDDTLPLAAWLMQNPSRADGEVDDQTVLRANHFTRKLGAGGWIGTNVIPYRATDPADMLAALRCGRISAEMLSMNAAAIEGAANSAKFHVVAFGVLGPELAWHRKRALEHFAPWSEQLLCLGTSPAGWPLHPLARGKFAIRNEVELREWIAP